MFVKWQTPRFARAAADLASKRRKSDESVWLNVVKKKGTYCINILCPASQRTVVLVDQTTEKQLFSNVTFPFGHHPHKRDVMGFSFVLASFAPHTLWSHSWVV